MLIGGEKKYCSYFLTVSAGRIGNLWNYTGFIIARAKITVLIKCLEEFREILHVLLPLLRGTSSFSSKALSGSCSHYPHFYPLLGGYQVNATERFPLFIISPGGFDYIVNSIPKQRCLAHH